MVVETREYEKLKKCADKYRMELMKIWDSNKRLINAFVKNILKRDIRPYTIIVVNEE